MSQTLELDEDEYRHLMQFRHKEEIEVHSKVLLHTIALCQGRTQLSFDQVKTLATAAQALHDLHVKCGYKEIENCEIVVRPHNPAIEGDDDEPLIE